MQNQPRKNKILSFLKPYMLSIGLLLLASFLILWGVYKLDFQYRYLSNSLFIPNIIVFIVSIGINLGAINIVNPLKYTVLKFINPENTKEKYGDYAGYLEQKEEENKNYWFLTTATLTLLVVAGIFAVLSA
jgi:hypothetical protein